MWKVLTKKVGFGGDGENISSGSAAGQIDPLPAPGDSDEDESVLFTSVAQAYVYQSSINYWTPLGTGPIKILWNTKYPKEFFVVMKSDQDDKTVIRHPVTKDMVVSFHQDSTRKVRWTVLDAVQGNITMETIYACRFADDNEAVQFKRIFDWTIQVLSDSGTSSSKEKN